MADAADSKSAEVTPRVGSSPTFGTTQNYTAIGNGGAAVGEGDTHGTDSASGKDLAIASGNPRASAVAALLRNAAELVAAGDFAGARALHAAASMLLGDARVGGEVVDLADRRRGK